MSNLGPRLCEAPSGQIATKSPDINRFVLLSNLQAFPVFGATERFPNLLVVSLNGSFLINSAE